MCQLLRWYQQFYVGVEEIKPEMVNRFEDENDTERALASWQEEIVANVAVGLSAISSPAALLE